MHIFFRRDGFEPKCFHWDYTTSEKYRRLLRVKNIKESVLENLLKESLSNKESLNHIV